MASNLAKRVAVAAVGIPVAFGLIYIGGWPLVILLAAAGVLGVGELQRFAAVQQMVILQTPALALAALVAPVTYLALTNERMGLGLAAWWPYLLAAIVMLLLAWAVATRAPSTRPLAGVSVTLFALCYAAALPVFLLAIRHRGHGTFDGPATLLVVFPLVTTWICDSFAMFGGMLVGGPKLAPVVSPGKTISGGLAGVVGALGVGAVFELWVFPRAGIVAPAGATLLIAGVLGVVAQMGDLVESLLKRDVGLKDSGTLLPGHGGVLDRFDSLYFVLPVTAGLYSLLGVGA